MNSDDKTIMEGEDNQYTYSMGEHPQTAYLCRHQPRTVVIGHPRLSFRIYFKGEQSDWQLVKGLVSSPDDPRYEVYTRRLQAVRAIRNYMYVMQILPRVLFL